MEEKIIEAIQEFKKHKRVKWKNETIKSLHDLKIAIRYEILAHTGSISIDRVRDIVAQLNSME